MNHNNSKHWLHLYWRAGFGLSPKELERKQGSNIQQEVEQLVKRAKRKTEMANIGLSILSAISPNKTVPIAIGTVLSNLQSFLPKILDASYDELFLVHVSFCIYLQKDF